MLPGLVGLVAVGSLLWAVGCGGDEGVSAGATVNAYVGASLCAEAQGAMARSGGRAGEVNLRVVCLADPKPGGRLDLTTVGANARRATEDSSAIAYIEAQSPANRFAQPIVEEAGIAWTRASSGSQAMRRVLRAVEDAGSGSGSLRDEVRKTLEAE